MVFQVGNVICVGRKRPKFLYDALLRECVQSPEKLKAACEAVLDKAASGDLAAFEFLITRLEGKPVQAVNIEDDEGQNLFTGIRMIVMKQDNPLITIDNEADNGV